MLSLTAVTRLQKATCVGMVIMLALLCHFSVLELGYAENETTRAQKLRELQQNKSILERKAQEIRRKKKEKQQQAAKYNTSLIRNQRELERKKRSRVYHVQNLENTKNRISYLDNRIDRTTGDAARLSDDAAKRLRSLYMGERLSLLQMVLEAKDLSSLLDKLYYKKKIVAQDKNLLGNLRAKISELNGLKGELAHQKVVLDSTIQTIKVQEKEIAKSAEIDRALRDKYLSDARYYERAEGQLLQESNSITRELQSLTPKKLTLDRNVATGMMMWPLRAPVRSTFGYRTHPIHKKRTMHTGLDIGGPNGAAIAAADGGMVIFAGWKGGYGKCVMINHGFKAGANIVTLYGHLSSIGVGVGQYVNKGQTIAREGSTGFSTGPHLHFEVRRNGAPVNPYGYLP